MKLKDVMNELSIMGNETTKRILMNHGAKEPLYGVKIESLKKLKKRIGNNHDLGMQLYDTGNSDAMYLAGMLINPSNMTKENIKDWVHKAYWYMLSEYVVASVVANHSEGYSIAKTWIKDDKENIGSSGWSTLSGIVSITDDNKLNMADLSSLMYLVQSSIHQLPPNRVRYSMNMFVISVGCYVKPLLNEALDVAKTIGKVDVDMGATSCKVSMAYDYIKKCVKMNRQGRKRKKVHLC